MDGTQVDSFFSRQLEVLEQKWSELDDQIAVASVVGGAGRADSDSEAGVSSEGDVADTNQQRLSSSGVRPQDSLVVATHRGMCVSPEPSLHLPSPTALQVSKLRGRARAPVQRLDVVLRITI